MVRLLNPEGEGSWGSGILVKTGPRWDRHSEEWVVHFAGRPNDPLKFSDESMKARIQELFKLPELPVEVLSIGNWSVDRVSAENAQIGHIFLVGDALHRHPPTNGLGLNGGIQDVHNLCWKLKEVLVGQAGEALLDTYQEERLPIAVANCDWAVASGPKLPGHRCQYGINAPRFQSRKH